MSAQHPPRPEDDGHATGQPAVFQGRVLPGGQAFEAPADLPLLQAIERAGIAWAGSCRNGSCRTCIGLLEGGAVRYRIDWPSLSPEERAEGYVLPCAAYPISDVALRFVGL